MNLIINNNYHNHNHNHNHNNYHNNDNNYYYSLIILSPYGAFQG